ncbi:potassium channel family protein [Pontibacillus litoralis]|uniref:Ion transporter n=1 Tax=Pontibacillus litoralis JSM 072002 TaxID=1385512 RepID=A0A0A5GDH3_9BACI|nr:potassium channel family protein [Pontibacillus litoralis]KGX89170.1 ion transporter [Pontibacillus litoralis JSM 072002]
MIFFRKLFLKMIKINNTVLIISSMLLLSVSSMLVVLLEPETFPNYFDGLWWALTTVTTVGYGDYAPVTVEGRMVGIVLYIFGIGLIGVLIGKIVEALSVFRKKRREGDIVYKDKHHYIIIGWSQKASYAVKEMLETMEEVEIIVIDDLEIAPILEENIHYIRGNASSMETLQKANVQEAKAVLIFADDSMRDSQLIDGKTLLIASTVESMAPNVHTVVEVMEENHIKNFEHANVDEFIFSHETISSLAVRSAFTKGISGVYGQLMRRSHGDDLFHIPLNNEWKTYRDAFDSLLQQGATLIADRQNLSINRMLDDPLPSEAELYVICDKKTYRHITEGN